MFAHKIAIRNLIKNKFRTLASLAMICGALIALTIFRGYVLLTLEFMENTIVNGQFGHLQIAKENYWTKNYNDKKETLIAGYQPIIENLEKVSGVIGVEPRVKFYGLMSTDQVSDSAMVIGINLESEKNIESGFLILQGERFVVGQHRVMIGNLLASRLQVKLGDDVTVIATTTDNVVNAVDLQVAGVFASGVEEFDSMAAFIDLGEAQRLIDSETVEVMKISAEKGASLDRIKNDIEVRFADQGLKVKTWREVSTLFRKVKSFYNTQTGLMFGILVFIVILGISNTVSMSLAERIGEIGTLRAIGQSQISLLKQFMLESFYLCAFAIVLGGVVSYLLIALINSAEIMTEIPGASMPLMIKVGFYFDVLAAFSLGLFIIVNLFTGVLVWKFVQAKIVESLRHNL